MSLKSKVSSAAVAMEEMHSEERMRLGKNLRRAVEIETEDLPEEDEIENQEKLTVVVRRAQEGKTYICIQDINTSNPKEIHLIVTMNTIKSNIQFITRVVEKVGNNRIAVLNSSAKGNSKHESYGGCHHVKDLSSLLSLIISNDIKVIIMCAHNKRMREDIPRLVELCSKMTPFTVNKQKIKIHIDEAHKYVPPNRSTVSTRLYPSPIVTSIVMYSATAHAIWEEEPSSIFSKMLVVDVAEKYQVGLTTDYFGVKDAELIISDFTPEQIDAHASECIPLEIDSSILNLSNTPKTSHFWYTDRYWFDLGNERRFLSYISLQLPKIGIPQTGFSYNFIPAYRRRVTHYKVAELILNEYPQANVIIINGNGTALQRKNPSGDITTRLFPNTCNEISEQIYGMIADHRDYPTFITGMDSVGMSVTFINETIGNFDTVIMSHTQCRDHDVYQLCRFLFNYTNWSPEGKANRKITRLYSDTRATPDICLDYEANIIYIIRNKSGQMCTIDDLKETSEEDEEETENKVKEPTKKDLIYSLSDEVIYNEGKSTPKKIKVYGEGDENNAEEAWKKVRQHWEKITGHPIPSKSMPKKNAAGFYECSTTKTAHVQELTSLQNTLAGFSFHSNFQLKKGCLAYARIYVGYHDLENNEEYDIFIRSAVFEDNCLVHDVLELVGK